VEEGGRRGIVREGFDLPLLSLKMEGSPEPKHASSYRRRKGQESRLPEFPENNVTLISH
jgi:hypothetical protein